MTDKIAIIAVCEEDNLLVLDTICHPEIALINFPIVKNIKDYRQNRLALMHSLATSPACYVEHALYKAKSIIDENLFLLNPLIEISESCWLEVLSTLKMLDHNNPALIMSQNELPIGIYLPRKIFDNKLSRNDLIPWRFLSWVSATLDYAILQAVLAGKNLKIILKNASLSEKTLFYTLPTYLTNYKLVAANYLKAILRNHGNIDQISDYIAVLPYHAGDILLFAKALQQSSSIFTSLVVSACYSDIIKEINLDLKLIIAEADPPLRGSNADSSEVIHQNRDIDYFYTELYALISKDTPYYYFKPCRDHNLAEFHLIDQWKYSLCNDDFKLVSEIESENISVKHLNQDIGKSILLHLGGGWPLKIYPEKYQQDLISQLKQQGYKVSVLSDKPLPLSADANVMFTDIASLKKLITSHAIFIGMDSFPAHYAAHVLQHPSITLFSSTSITIHNAPNNLLYQSISRGLACSPCRRTHICPVFNSDYCHNFLSPDEVCHKINQMYQAIYCKRS